MNPQQIQLITDRDIIENIINNKFINDYGIIQSISPDNKFANIEHSVLQTLNGIVITTTMVTLNVELFYLSTSSIVFDNQPQIGDPVLLLGLKRYIAQTQTPMPPPAGPQTEIAYNRSTLKAIPLSAINSQSLLTFRGKNGKIRLRNQTISLFKIINDINSSLITFATGLNVGTLSAQATALVIALQQSTLEIASLLED